MAAAHVLLGLAAAAGAAACFDGAVILQATEARTAAHELTLRPSLLTTLARRPRWVAGVVLGVLGWPLQLAAFALAPVTLVQPALALGMVLLLVVGDRALGEPSGPAQWRAAGAIVVGVGLVAWAAPEHTSSAPHSVALAVACAALALITAAPLVASRRAWGAPALIVGAGTAFALSAITSKMITIELAAGALLAVAGWGVLTAAAAGAGFLVDTSAMQRFRATRVAPPMFVVETAVPVALAPVLFGERWGATPGGGAVIVAGLVLVLAGGALLAADEAQQDVRRGGQGAVPGVGPAR